ncbi:bifunctional apoptosis regulator-like isoform X1 [Synchiropus splendidus]|uniref:bifunctional apoptosis regulator-like isoform X1 n=1 Tax=Synchiropus splendidus TaxID=270530 RepID=UPI00237E6699|nr:bifunctional apoptosis regulator-like isoform X1 [Synchiropus splendidus]
MEQDPRAEASSICQQELLCHCCYDILLDPTTLTCGHSFCRHCLAQWWVSSRKKECPECREKWEGFPKINILLRETTQKLFCADVQRRRAEIQADPNVSQSLLAFQRHGGNSGRSNTSRQRGAKLFLYGAFAAFVCVAVKEVLFSFSRSSLAPDDQRPNKPVPHWTPEEVGSWLDQLGPWTQLYRESFLEHSINGRLLLMLEEEELFSPPFHVLNTAQRRTILAELDQLKSPLTKTPQNLWEYKEENSGKSLFLLYALKRSPRLTLFYLYLFDYYETFLPFFSVCCPPANNRTESSFLSTQLEPGWPQWAEFLVMCLLLPYMLIAEFAWSWLSVQYWTSHFIIVNAALLSVLEGFALWRLWNRAEIRTLPRKMWNHSWSMILQGFAFALLWPFVPQFVCNCFFYWALYCSPVVNIDRVVRQLISPETQ